ncbi:MAG: hypothetical protein KAR40_11175 [Candidatus Sabulitectum sp.]|nr:hypothetical protein [Candidatus Sabulitectum sp.]
MSTVIGNSGDVTIGANIVAEILGWELSEGTNVADDTVLGDASASHKAGTKNWTATVNGYYDKTDTTGQGAMVNGASVIVHLRDEGAGAGNIDRTGTATVTGLTESVSNDAIVPISFTLTGNGDLARDTLV